MKTAAFIASVLPLALAQNGKKYCGTSGTTIGDYNFSANAYLSADATGSECLTVDSASSSGVKWQSHWQWSNVGAADGAPIAYPYAGLNFPRGKKISAINSMPTKAQWNYTNTGSIAVDVSYDLFTSSNPDNPTTYGEYELMIWLGHYGGKTPISSTGSPIGHHKIDNVTWAIYYGNQTINGVDQQTYSFYAPNNKKSWNGDVKKFFGYLTQKYSFPASSQYLLTYEFGTETFSGGPATFQVDHWSADIQG